MANKSNLNSVKRAMRKDITSAREFYTIAAGRIDKQTIDQKATDYVENIGILDKKVEAEIIARNVADCNNSNYMYDTALECLNSAMVCYGVSNAFDDELNALYSEAQSLCSEIRAAMPQEAREFVDNTSDLTGIMLNSIVYRRKDGSVTFDRNGVTLRPRFDQKSDELN